MVQKSWIHQLRLVDLAHFLQGFNGVSRNPRWLFGISEPSTVCINLWIFWRNWYPKSTRFEKMFEGITFFWYLCSISGWLKPTCLQELLELRFFEIPFNIAFFGWVEDTVGELQVIFYRRHQNMHLEQSLRGKTTSYLDHSNRKLVEIHQNF